MPPACALNVRTLRSVHPGPCKGRVNIGAVWVTNPRVTLSGIAQSEVVAEARVGARRGELAQFRVDQLEEYVALGSRVSLLYLPRLTVRPGCA